MLWNGATASMSRRFGFSQRTCLPFAIAASAIGAWNEFGVAMITASIAEYNGLGAVFSKRSIRLLTLDTDAQNIALDKSVPQAGTNASRSVIPYSNTDVFYLDQSGIRSLRARDSSNVPSIDDVGTAVDEFVQDYIGTISGTTVAKAVSVIEPRDRRLWMAVGGYIMTLSSYPRSKITAWSYQDPGFTVSDFAVIDKSLYVRSGDTVYLYGGPNGTTYPDANQQTVSMKTPYMAGEKLATLKMLKGFDVGATNVWDTYLLVNPNDETQKLHIGRVHGTTYAEPNVALGARTTHAALEMDCSAAGAATISSFALHYDADEAN